MTQLLTTIPFSGFYHSIHDQAFDDTLVQMFSDHNTGYDFDPHNLDPWYDACSAVFNAEYSQAFTQEWADAFNIPLTFESMESPRYYNYETDRIFAHIDMTDLIRLLLSTDFDMDGFKAFVRKRFTSRDGFISHYSSDLIDWPHDLTMWDHNQVGTVLSFIQCEEWGDDDEINAHYLMDGYSGNGCYEEWVLRDNPKLIRKANIHDYLERRSDRKPFTWADHRRDMRAKNLDFADTPLGASA